MSTSSEQVGTTGTPVVAPDTENSTPTPNLVALDRALAPLRRLLDYISSGKVPRYLEPNALRWLTAASSLGIPAPLDAALNDSLETLQGVEGDAEKIARWAMETRARIRRLDALLGLPIGAPIRPVHRSFPKQRPEAPPARSKSKARPAPEKDREARASRRAPELPEDDVFQAWNGDLRRELSSMSLPGADALAAVEIETVGDLLLRAPVSEEVLKPVYGAGRDTPVGRVAIGGRVRARYSVVRPGGIEHRVLLVGAGPQTVICEGEISSGLKVGRRVVFAGTLTEDGLLRDSELCLDDGRRGVRLQQYGIASVPDKTIRKVVWSLRPNLGKVRDPLSSLFEKFPTAFSQRVQPLSKALEDAHTIGSLAARERLALDESLSVFVGRAIPRFSGQRQRGLAQPVVHDQACALGRVADFEFNDAQQLAMEDLKRDLRASTPMRRLLAGPVGDGKGVVALVAMTTAAANKHQVVYVAPDAVTAESRFLFAEPLFRELGYTAKLCLGELGRGMKDALKTGNCHILYVTPEFLSGSPEMRRLGLVVFEESERWGNAAQVLGALGTPTPDVLVHCGGALPRDAILSAYPDFDLTWLEQADRQVVSTSRWESDKRLDAYTHAAEAIARNQQVLVVFPTKKATGTDLLDAREANRVVSALRTDAMPEGCRVALYHGGMSREERRRVFLDFRHHRCDVLVATYPPELGPDLPRLAVTVVERAEHLSSLRLRRLKGQLQRSLYGGELLLVVGEVPDADATKRMAVIADSDDDSHVVHQLSRDKPLAEILEDTAELPNLQWSADIDRTMLLGARTIALNLLATDGSLRQGGNSVLARSVRQWWRHLYPDQECPVGEPGHARKRRRRRRKR